MERYDSWARKLDLLYLAISDISTVLSYLTLDQRKLLMTQCRCQVLPRPDTRLYLRNVKQYNQVLELPTEGTQTTYYTLLDFAMTLDKFTNPVFAGLLSMLLRCVPFKGDTTCIEVEIESGTRKEVQAAVTPFKGAQFDYTTIFSDLPPRKLPPLTELFLDIPDRTHVIKDTRICLNKAKGKLRGRIFYPRISSKTPGKICKRNMTVGRQMLEFVRAEQMSHVDAEKVYEVLGFRFCGPTALGRAWKYNELKPRLFYNLGLTDAQASFFVQPIFNIILDEFINVHRFKRFHARTMSLSYDDLLMIYDYSAFTSTMDEIAHFTRSLATYFKGTVIHVLDLHDGLVERDLGELLMDYSNQCNSFEEIDAGDIFEMADFILYHTGGKLGIPGNISASTLLHGIHLAILVGSYLRNKVVGDDAIGSFPKYLTEDVIFAFLDQLGIISRVKAEKFYPVEEDEDVTAQTYNYVKRPVTRIGNHALFGALVTWPNLANILGLHDNFHTPTSTDAYTRRKIYSAQFSKFTRDLAEFGVYKEDMEVINILMRSWHDHLRIDRDGSLSVDGLAMVPPAYFSGGNVWLDWIDIHYNSIDRFPVIGTGSEKVDETCILVGAESIVPMDPFWKLMRSLKYVECEALFSLRVVSDPYVKTFLLHEFPKNCRPLYKISVVSQIPIQFRSMLATIPYYVPSESLVSRVPDDEIVPVEYEAYYVDSDSSDEM